MRVQDRTATFRSWADMRSRCLNENSKHYHRYGGRGIKICDRWLESFDNFLTDMGEKPESLTLERVNNDGNYTPENCLWATRQEQAINRNTTKFIKFRGEKKTLRQWAEYYNLKTITLYSRIHCYGWSLKQALNKPVLKRNRIYK